MKFTQQNLRCGKYISDSSYFCKILSIKNTDGIVTHNALNWKRHSLKFIIVSSDINAIDANFEKKKEKTS